MKDKCFDASDENQSEKKVLRSPWSPPSKLPSSAVHTTAVEHLLSFATTSPAAFKEVTETMDSASKDTLETSIRQAIGNGVTANSRPAAKPQISLRSF